VQHSDPQPLQRPVRQIARQLLDARIGQVAGDDLVIRADPRADDEDLASDRHLLADPLPGALQPRGTYQGMDDRRLHILTSGGYLAQRGDLQIPEDGHRDRARNRGRGHHQQVRHQCGPALQHRTLLDTETVLLIDHDQSEIGERHRLRQQRMGTHDDACPATGDGVQRGPTLRSALRARQ